VESRATTQDTDVAGNISGGVLVSVGELPRSGGGDGDAFFGSVSGGTGPAVAALAVSAAIFLAFGFVLGGVFWRWRKRKGPGNTGNDGQ
jgi:hypothetical protein